MGKYSVIEYRNVNDFKYGSFDVYVKPDEVMASGLRKRGMHSRYMLIRRND